MSERAVDERSGPVASSPTGGSAHRPWGGRAALALLGLLAGLLTAASLAWPGAPTKPDESPPPQQEIRYLSEMPYTAIANGRGPVERDATNGDEDAEDGEPIELGGTRYEHGLGVYPFSHVRIRRPPGCQRFLATIGTTATDESGARVMFKVLADGRPLYRSEPLAAADGPRSVEIDVGDAERLDLVVTNRETGDDQIAAVWADARLECQG